MSVRSSSMKSVGIAVLTVLVRLCLVWLFPSLSSTLDQSVEFSTPVTSYRSLQEALFLNSNAQSDSTVELYNGGVVHHPILLIKAMQLVPLNYHYLIFILFDCLIVFQLWKLTRQVNRHFKNINLPNWLPSLLYSINPIVILSCHSKSTIIFTNWSILASLLYALEGNLFFSSFFIVLAGYLSLYPILLVIPLINIVNYNSETPKIYKTISLLCQAALFSTLFLCISYKLNGESWNFIQANYMTILNFEIVTPNLGIWWYFFIEMFTEFIPFFKAVFNLFLVSIIIPMAIRFKEQPLYAFIVCLGWINLTKPYPVLGDIGFWFTLLTYFAAVSGYMRYKVFSMLLFIHGVMLSPIFYYLWVGLGSGNSNFFYAISLVYALAIGTILTDLTWSMLRYEYDGETPDYNLKLTQL